MFREAALNLSDEAIEAWRILVHKGRRGVPAGRVLEIVERERSRPSVESVYEIAARYGVSRNPQGHLLALELFPIDEDSMSTGREIARQIQDTQQVPVHYDYLGKRHGFQGGLFRMEERLDSTLTLGEILTGGDGKLRARPNLSFPHDSNPVAVELAVSEIQTVHGVAVLAHSIREE